MLKQWTAKGKVFTFCNTTSDEQEAWGSLLGQYEGDDARSATIAKARKTVASAHFVRATPNFCFTDYCNKVIQANKELDRYKANVEVKEQIQSFITGIQAEAMDP